MAVVQETCASQQCSLQLQHLLEQSFTFKSFCFPHAFGIEKKASILLDVVSCTISSKAKIQSLQVKN